LIQVKKGETNKKWSKYISLCRSNKKDKKLISEMINNRSSKLKNWRLGANVNKIGNSGEYIDTGTKHEVVVAKK